MSTASKITLYGSCVFSIGIIAYVNYSQWADQRRLHEGVIRDVERQQMRKIENIYMLQQQSELAKELRKQQDNEVAT